MGITEPILTDTNQLIDSNTGSIKIQLSGLYLILSTQPLMCVDSEFLDIDKYQWPQIKLSSLNTYSVKKNVLPESFVISMFHPFQTPACYLLTFRTKESVSTDMIIIPCKTAYYNNAHGEIPFPEVGYN